MASVVRVLHCAGFRFDSPSWEGPEEWVTQRNQDLWQTFEGVLSLCLSEKIDFLLLAGNLFEQEYVRKETVERVAKSFAKLEGTKVFIVPGERDPLVTTSAYRLAVWPSNVHIFSGGLSSVKTSLNVTVYGAGCTSYCQEEPFLDDFQTSRDGTLQLMLLHTEVGSVKNKSLISILPEQIAASGLDYLALGHRDVWSEVRQEGETYWADCGSSEARSFRESGPHGVLLGEIEKGSVRLEFRELGQRRYIEKTLAIEPDMAGLVEKLLAETSTQERQKNIFRLKLAGSLEDVEAAVPALQNVLEGKFRYIEVLPSEGRPSQAEQDIVNKVGRKTTNGYGFPILTQLFADKIKERLDVLESSEDYEHWELVQRIGLAALGQGREDDED
ncbi:hypothetical protein [Desulfosporosinus sp. BG]|uniref:metallophosphoesterase family protein n=1 Tax=Desulfosporosinus sp. BG TaxID=1633135 RepID=UPI00083B2264|nr:hypothetical protein [Desulfosporosinus sp. BG]ODA40514.1 DNA double-strand break repair protein Mre11 [Desulfosporosinus sp. BG]